MQALYERYLPLVWRYAYAHSASDLHLAEDVVAETFLALVQAVGKLDPSQGTPAPWLLAVARNKLSDHRRKARTHANAELLTGQIDPEDSGSLAAVEEAERRQWVAGVLDRLSDEERLVLEWKYLEGRPVREIAVCLNRTEKAVESVLFRARRAFKSWAERLGDTDVCQKH